MLSILLFLCFVPAVIKRVNVSREQIVPGGVAILQRARALRDAGKMLPEHIDVATYTALPLDMVSTLLYKFNTLLDMGAPS
jgi:hypothetical protein